MNKKIPKYVLDNMGLQTQRQFKQVKRYQLRMLAKALDEYRMGCAYCPSQGFNIGGIDRRIGNLRNRHSVKNWGK